MMKDYMYSFARAYSGLEKSLTSSLFFFSELEWREATVGATISSGR
jgi:hypothetical protein